MGLQMGVFPKITLSLLYQLTTEAGSNLFRQSVAKRALCLPQTLPEYKEHISKRKHLVIAVEFVSFLDHSGH